jgi:mRNA interferase HicA
MRRVDLIGRIRVAARHRGHTWVLVRQGSAHEVWALGGTKVTIPRHREISERTARSIMQALADELGERWWL